METTRTSFDRGFWDGFYGARDHQTGKPFYTDKPFYEAGYDAGRTVRSTTPHEHSSDDAWMKFIGLPDTKTKEVPLTLGQLKDQLKEHLRASLSTCYQGAIKVELLWDDEAITSDYIYL